MALTDHKTLPVLTPEAVTAFWAKVARGSPDECWLWQGARVRDGYGNFSVDGENYRASRVAYFLCRGDFDQGLLIRHTCDNPPCVNPAHLVPGTSTDNTLDALKRGRWQRFTSGTPVQLNYVIPPELEDKLESYCQQTGVGASALIRRLVSEYVKGDLKAETMLPHPRGRRTSLTLSEPLLEALEKRVKDDCFQTKAALVATLLDLYLASRTTDELVRVEIDLSPNTLDQLAAQFGSAAPGEIVRRALASIVGNSKESL